MGSLPIRSDGLPCPSPTDDDRQISSEDRRSVKLRVRPPPAGTHQCHRATSAGSGMMLTVKLGGAGPLRSSQVVVSFGQAEEPRCTTECRPRFVSPRCWSCCSRRVPGQSGAVGDWEMPRTSWGEPDLQGSMDLGDPHAPRATGSTVGQGCADGRGHRGVRTAECCETSGLGREGHARQRHWWLQPGLARCRDTDDQ